MKNALRIFMMVFAVLGVTAIFGYWNVNQFNIVLDDLEASFSLNTNLDHTSLSKSDTGLASTTPKIAGFTTSTEALAPTSTKPLTATTTDEVIEDEEAVKEPAVFVLIKETGLGYLNARTGPGLGFEKILELESGDAFELIGEEGGWYNLKIDENENVWVISKFVELSEGS